MNQHVSELLDEMEASGDIQQYYVQEAVRTIRQSRDSDRELLACCQELQQACSRVVSCLEDQTGLKRYTVVMRPLDADHPGCQVVHHVTAADIPSAVEKSSQLLDGEEEHYPEMIFRGWVKLVAHQPERLDYRIVLETLIDDEEE